MIKPFLFAAAVLMLTGSTMAQTILTGTWEGSAGGNYCKLVIVQVGDSLFGYTYDTGFGYCKANFTGTYSDSTKKVVGKNTSFIEKTFFHAKSIYHLTYSKKGNTAYLKGRAAAKTIGAKIYSFGLPLPVNYIKRSDSVDSTALIGAKLAMRRQVGADTMAQQTLPTVKNEVAVNDSAALPAGASASALQKIKESRSSAIVQTITTAADTVRILLYDNGEIDGDTVTIFLNGKMIVERLGLTVMPFEKMIVLPKDGTKQVIELMANNLGTIPPNTAYMLVLAANERVEVKLSSDEKSNAAVIVQHSP